MTKSRVFFVLLVAFIAGVFGRSFWEISEDVFFLLPVAAITVAGIFYADKKAVLAAFAALFFIFGAWKTDGAIKKTENLTYENANFQGNALVVKSSPNVFGQNLILELEKDPPSLSTESSGGQGKIFMLAQVAKYPEYAYGDLLDVSCTAKAIENRDAGFDYRMYMAKEGVRYACDKPKIKKVAEGKGNMLLGGIFKVRDLFENNIRKAIPQPEGALAAGLLLGGSDGLPRTVKDDFSRTGMTHIVAVSGYNVTIIAEYLVVLGIALGMWRKRAIWFALAGIVLFVTMVGLPASAVRAGVMGGTLLWAMKNGRLSDSENAIIFAGAAMLLLNPLLLRWDVGFQLSFLATLGIVVLSPLWEKSFVRKNKALGISEVIAMSLSAQVFVLPIIAYNFHIASLVSLLANVLILPVVPLAMLAVFLVSVTGFVFSGLSAVFAWLAYVPLTYEIKLIHILAQLPWASVAVEKVSVRWIFGYYLAIVAIVYFLRKKEKSYV